MIDDFFEVFGIINLQIYLFSILLFFIGYAFAPTAYFKKIKWLTAYSFFIINLIDKHFNKDWHPIKIFIVYNFTFIIAISQQKAIAGL